MRGKQGPRLGAGGDAGDDLAVAPQGVLMAPKHAAVQLLGAESLRLEPGTADGGAAFLRSLILSFQSRI